MNFSTETLEAILKRLEKFRNDIIRFDVALFDDSLDCGVYLC